MTDDSPRPTDDPTGGRDTPTDERDDPVVAVPQIAVDDREPDRNLDRIRQRVTALPNRVDVALFPEYALTGFAADDRVGATALSRREVVDRLAPIARANDVGLLAGHLESAGDGEEPYNASTYVPRDVESVADATTYRKRHLWGEESTSLRAGTDRVVVETPAGRTGVLTCYDLNFVAESAWLTERAVDAVFVVGAWPAAHVRNWRLLCRARALDGVRWLVGAGRTGEGRDGTAYAGNSLVVRPDGHVAASVGREARDLIAPLDRDTLAGQRAIVESVDTKYEK